MVLTFTGNPSVDLLFEVERLVRDDANRVEAPRRRAGGQGINVARAIRELGGSARAVAPLGGRTGQELAAMLQREGTGLRWVTIRGETRTFVGVRETETGHSLLLNPRGPVLDEAEVERLARAVAEEIEVQKPVWLACCGSLAPGAPPALYARIGAAARDRGVRVVPDCDGDALRLTAESGCDLLVPNVHEAGRLLGTAIETPAAAGDAARALQKRGPDLVAVTLGADGAVLADATGAWLAVPPALQAGSAVGAGDAFLAGLLLALEDGVPAADALVRGVAVGTAVLLSEGEALLRRADAEAISREVRLTRL